MGTLTFARGNLGQHYIQPWRLLAGKESEGKELPWLQPFINGCSLMITLLTGFWVSEATGHKMKSPVERVGKKMDMTKLQSSVLRDGAQRKVTPRPSIRGYHHAGDNIPTYIHFLTGRTYGGCSLLHSCLFLSTVY